MKIPILQVALVACFFPFSNLFSFYYPDENVRVHYRYQDTITTKVIFNVSQTVKNMSEVFIDVWDKLRTPFNITYPQTIDATDSIFLQAGDFFMLTSTISDIQTKHSNLLKTLNAPPLNVSAYKNISIELDSAVLTQIIKNIKISQARLEIMMKESVTIDKLKNNKENLSKFLSIFEDLNTDAVHVMDTLNDFYSAIQLTYHKVKTNYIQEYLLPSNESEKIDLNYEILRSYLENDNLICLIEQHMLKNPIHYIQFYPIPYNNLSIEHNYILNQNTSKIEQLFTHTQLEKGEDTINEQCLSLLNINFLTKKNISNIIEQCHFIQNHELFQETQKGLFIFNISQTDLIQINKQFKNETNITLSIENVPFYIEFNGSIKLNTPFYGNTSFTKHHKTKYTFSNLTNEEKLSIISTQNIYNRMIYDFANLDQLFIDNYLLLLIASTITLTYILLFALLKCTLNICKKKEHKALDRLMRSRANRHKNKRVQKTYKLSHY